MEQDWEQDWDSDLENSVPLQKTNSRTQYSVIPEFSTSVINSQIDGVRLHALGKFQDPEDSDVTIR